MNPDADARDADDTDADVGAEARSGAEYETFADTLRRAIEDEHGYRSWLGTRVDAVDPGRTVLSVLFDETVTNPTSPSTVVETAASRRRSSTRRAASPSGRCVTTSSQTEWRR